MQTYEEQNKGNSNGYPKTDAIKKDLTALKEHTATLAKEVKDKGQGVLRDGVDQLIAAAQDEFPDIEKRVKEKPGQSILLAFAAGMFASFLLGSRR